MAEGANEDFEGFEFAEVLEAVIHGEAFLQELPSDIEVSDISRDEDEPPVEDVPMPDWSKEFTDIGMEPLAVNDVGPRHHLSYMSSVLKFFYLMVSELFFFTMVDGLTGVYGNPQPPTTFKLLERSSGTRRSSFQKHDSSVAFREAHAVFSHQRSRVGIAPWSSEFRLTSESAANPQPSF